jgi:hypothetical protein
MRSKLYIACCAVLAFALYDAVAPIPASSHHYTTVGWKPGDIVFVEGKSLRSSVVRFLEFGHSDYSHVGLIVFDHDMPFVIHADPLRGRVVKEKWDLLLSPDRICEAAVFRVRGVSDAAISRACAIAEDDYFQAIPFNSDFDLATPNKLYCTELIWRAYLAAGIDLRKKPYGSDSKYLLPSELIENKALIEIAHF